jgi:hypothetical protein|tara:strand:+ start:9617 stop:10567 length:951 start_codon:yes stop_codon:yes gene_type:complete
MAAFTTIAAATVSIGGSVAKGILAGDAATDAARQAGRLNLEKDRLEKEAVADLEQNFYDALRANTDIYDKQLQTGNAMGAQILEAVQEGDQRGVAAGAGKVKQVQDATLGATADKFAAEKSEIDKLKAAAGEASAEEIAALKDDRAAAAGVQADALTQQASDLSGQATGSFIDAGVSALGVAANLMGKNAMGKAAQKLVDSGKYSTLSEATKSLGGLDNKALRAIAKGGEFIPKADSIVAPVTTVDPAATTDYTYNTPTMDADLPEGFGNPILSPQFSNQIDNTFLGGFGEKIKSIGSDVKDTSLDFLNKLKNYFK